MSEHRHLRLSLLLCALFLGLGLLLEAMIGLRAGGWVDEPLRREFLRLGHAHGGVLGLLNLAMAGAMARLRTPEGWARPVRAAAWSGATLVGLGFVAGGLGAGPTDPGPGILAVPAGALMLLAALAAVAIVRPSDLGPGGPANRGREPADD